MGLVSSTTESICRFLGIKPKAQSAEPIKIPRTVQESIPYLGAFENGIIQNDLRTYSKMYALPEINFVIESYDEQKKIFGRFMEFLGSFGTVKYKFRCWFITRVYAVPNSNKKYCWK